MKQKGANLETKEKILSLPLVSVNIVAENILSAIPGNTVLTVERKFVVLFAVQ